jgi:hypothetical protein
MHTLCLVACNEKQKRREGALSICACLQQAISERDGTLNCFCLQRAGKQSRRVHYPVVFACSEQANTEEGWTLQFVSALNEHANAGGQCTIPVSLLAASKQAQEEGAFLCYVRLQQMSKLNGRMHSALVLAFIEQRNTNGQWTLMVCWVVVNKQHKGKAHSPLVLICNKQAEGGIAPLILLDCGEKASKEGDSVVCLCLLAATKQRQTYNRCIWPPGWCLALKTHHL